MSMQSQIEHGEWYEVSANHGETHWVPADVVAGLEYIHVEAGKVDGATLVAKLQPFVEGTIDEDDGAAVVQTKRGWGARLHMPGCLDSTEWTVFDTEQEAIDYMVENYDLPQCELCRELLADDPDPDHVLDSHCDTCKGNDYKHPIHGDAVRVARFRYASEGVATLILWDGNGRDDAGRYRIEFRLLWERVGQPIETIFDVADGPFHGHVSVDGDKAVVGVMGFLTLRPGDTDADYFDKYTTAQFNWAETYAETISIEVMDRFGED